MLVGERVVGGGVGWGWVLNCCVILEKYRGMNGNDGFDFGWLAWDVSSK